MEPNAQLVTLVLISVIAPLGAIDAMYFHVWKFRLGWRPESRAETATHIARSLVLAVLAPLLAFWVPQGAWFWAIAALLGLDFANNLIDGFLEGDSRADLGGLPRVEYLIHLVGAALVGAATLSFMVAGWPAASLQTALIPAALPASLQVNGVIIGLGSLALAAVEASMLWVTRPSKTSTTSRTTVAQGR